MNILSQDKKTILNWSNTRQLQYENKKDENKKNYSRIVADYGGDFEYGLVIGNYKTEKRAKEVLGEITCFLSNQIGKTMYEMPKE